MADYGAGIIMENARMRGEFADRMFKQAEAYSEGLAKDREFKEGVRQFDEQLEYARTKPKDYTMAERDQMMIERLQNGDRSPAVLSYLRSRRAQEGQKTQFVQDGSGRLVPVAAPNPFANVLGDMDDTLGMAAPQRTQAAAPFNNPFSPYEEHLRGVSDREATGQGGGAFEKMAGVAGLAGRESLLPGPGITYQAEENDPHAFTESERNRRNQNAEASQQLGGFPPQPNAMENELGVNYQSPAFRMMADLAEQGGSTGGDYHQPLDDVTFQRLSMGEITMDEVMQGLQGSLPASAVADATGQTPGMTAPNPADRGIPPRRESGSDFLASSVSPYYRTGSEGEKQILGSGLNMAEEENKRRQERIKVLTENNKKMPESLLMLEQARNLNDQSYGGLAAVGGTVLNDWVLGSRRGWGEDPTATNTTLLKNILTSAGMAQIKDYVGAANISDGDRKAVLELQGTAEMNPAARAKVIDKNYASAQRAQRINELELEALHSGREWTPDDSRAVYREEFGIDFDTGQPIDKGTKRRPTSQYREGDTAKNPQTGERMIFRAGQWRPLQ